MKVRELGCGLLSEALSLVIICLGNHIQYC